jgi:hypothetical protein
MANKPMENLTGLKDSDLFVQLENLAQNQGSLAVACALVEKLRSDGRFAELFEARKMLHRMELGLPPVHVEAVSSANDTVRNEAEATGTGAVGTLDPKVHDELDKRLLDACREVGCGLMRAGRLQEGWMYLRAVGDNALTAEALSAVEPNQDNLDMLLNLYVHEGVDVGRGTQLSLKMRGTCNTITMLDSVVAMRGRADQQAAVIALVEHVHQELLANLIADVRRRQPNIAPPAGGRIVDWLELQPGLLRDGTYHLDTTHLASTVRFARVLDRDATLRLASDLAEYGRQLHAQYQYQSEEPFADLYPMSLAWFRALLGVFRQKAETLDPQEHGTVGIETYADLLARVGRPAEASVYLMKAMPSGMRPFGIAPSLLELAQAAGNFQPMKDHARNRGDLLGFAAALLQSSVVSSAPHTLSPDMSPPTCLTP